MSSSKPTRRGYLSAATLRIPVILGGVIFLLASARQAAATVITAMPVDFVAAESSAFNGAVAVFTDDNPSASASDFTATINWGDGSAPTVGTIGESSGAFVVLGSHTYADEGVFTATVTVSDVAPGTGTATATDAATITEADSLSGSPISFSAPLAVSFTTPVGTFSDTLASALPGDFVATINWGDATISAGTITGGGGAFQVSGTHTYSGSGTFSVVVTLSDDAPGTATAQVTSTAHVGASAVSVAANSFSVAEAAPFNGTVATFSDTDTTKTPSSFTATINWGDATTTAGTIVGGSGVFTLNGQHTYAEEGTFTVTATVTENAPGVATGSGTGTATVTETDVLTPTPMTFAATAGTPFSGPVAAFSDTNTTNVPSGFVVTINWGDGNTAAGTVTGGGGSFTASGTHTYAANGSFVVAVTLADAAPGTATATASSTANVAPASASASAVPTLDVWGLWALGLALGIAALVRLRAKA